MHRQIMNAPDGVPVDHKNRLPGDNRRDNLRFCNFQQNTFNRRVAPHSSRFQGVHFYKTYGKWVAHIR